MKRATFAGVMNWPKADLRSIPIPPESTRRAFSAWASSWTGVGVDSMGFEFACNSSEYNALFSTWTG